MAAFAAINKAVASTIALQVFEAKKTVIDQMIAFMADKIDMDDDMVGFFNEFKATIALEKVEVPKTKAPKGKNADGSDKKKREPSAYNLWIKDKMAEIKADQPDLKGKDLMAAAIALWKKLDVKPVANSNKPTSNKKAKVNENEESKDESNEESDSKSDSEVETPKPKKGRKPAAPKKQAVEDDEDEMAIAQPKKGRKPAANKKGKKANNDSDNSDSDSA